MPDAVLEAAQELARESGATANDALIRLAEEGIAVRGRRREIERLARERRDAVTAAGASHDPSDVPSPSELRAAMLSGRRAP